MKYLEDDLELQFLIYIFLTYVFSVSAADMYQREGVNRHRYLGIFGPRQLPGQLKAAANVATLAFDHRVVVSRDKSSDVYTVRIISLFTSLVLWISY